MSNIRLIQWENMNKIAADKELCEQVMSLRLQYFLISLVGHLGVLIPLGSGVVIVSNDEFWLEWNPKLFV